jgi:hypothetical protein
VHSVTLGLGGRLRYLQVSMHKPKKETQLVKMFQR